MRSPRYELQLQTWLMALPLASQQRPHWTQRCLRNGLTLNEPHERVGAADTDGPVPILMYWNGATAVATAQMIATKLCH
jgi:hypothetical protein